MKQLKGLNTETLFLIKCMMKESEEVKDQFSTITMLPGTTPSLIL